MKRKLIALLASAAFLATSTVSASADGYIPPPPKSGENGFHLTDDYFLAGDKASYIYSEIPGTDEQHQAVAKLCTAYKVAGCQEVDKLNVIANIILGVCVGNEVNCIEGISVYKKGTTPTPAILEKIVEGPTTPADLGADIPRGSSVGVWKAAGVPHSAGAETYSAYAKVRLHMVNGKASFENFVAGVVPTTESSERGTPAPYVRTAAGPNGAQSVEIVNSGPHCVYNYNMLCAHVQDFAPDTRVTMTLRLSNRQTGWLKGRLQDPKLELSAIDGNYNRLTVDASPVSVPQLAAFFNLSNLPASVSTALPMIKEHLIANRSGSASISTSSEPAFQLVEATRAFTGDRASGMSTAWSISNMDYSPFGGNSCLNDTKRVVGLVTTSAMVYDANPPKFANGQLNYRVAGMHSLADGTDASGAYDLIIRSDTARCLYGFTSAPISATVSVISSNGEAKAAVTSFKEDAGWVHFGAYGFSFSQPTIKVKMTQAKVVTKKTTITCISLKTPKLTKKVTAVSPKCPTGFKKK